MQFSIKNKKIINIDQPSLINKKLLKHKKERRVVRVARSGEDFDLVSTIENDNSFKVVCNFEDYQEQQTIVEQEKKIIDKLKRVPDDVQKILSAMLIRYNKKKEVRKAVLGYPNE